VDSSFEGTTSAREAYTGAAGERRQAVVRESQWREGEAGAKLQVLGVALHLAFYFSDPVVGPGLW
jgi:hypothetical protein